MKKLLVVLVFVMLLCSVSQAQYLSYYNPAYPLMSNVYLEVNGYPIANNPSAYLGFACGAFAFNEKVLLAMECAFSLSRDNPPDYVKTDWLLPWFKKIGTYEDTKVYVGGRVGVKLLPKEHKLAVCPYVGCGAIFGRTIDVYQGELYIWGTEAMHTDMAVEGGVMFQLNKSIWGDLSLNSKMLVGLGLGWNVKL